MESSDQFQYIYDNLALYNFQQDWLIFVSTLIFWCVLMISSYYAILGTFLQSKVFIADQALAKKKKTLGDLILMKDIQTELEKEIEQAVLKAAFHS